MHCTSTVAFPFIISAKICWGVRRSANRRLNMLVPAISVSTPHLHRGFAAVDTATFSWIRSATALVSLQVRVCPTKTPERAVMLLFNQITASCASSVSASAENAPRPMIKKLQWIASRPRHGLVQVPLTTAPQIQGLRRLGLSGTPSLGIHRQSFDELNRLRFTTGASTALRTSRNATNTIPKFFEHFTQLCR